MGWIGGGQIIWIITVPAGRLEMESQDGQRREGIFEVFRPGRQRDLPSFVAGAGDGAARQREQSSLIEEQPHGQDVAVVQGESGHMGQQARGGREGQRIVHGNRDDRDLLAAHQLSPHRGRERHRDPQAGQRLPRRLECVAATGRVTCRSIPIPQPVRAAVVIDYPDNHPIVRRVDVEEPALEA